MFKHYQIKTILFLSLIFMMLSCSQSVDWGSVNIEKTGQDEYHIVLENRLIRVTYGRAKDGKDKLIEFYCKQTNRKIGEFDSRHHPRDPYFHTLKNAEIVEDNSHRKTVRLDYGTRVEDVAVTKGTPFVEMNYHILNDYGHTYDRAGPGGDYVIYGAEKWFEIKRSLPDTTSDRSNKKPINQSELYPFYDNSYYRPEWGKPNPLSYKGWLILGMHQGNGMGYGILIPADKIKWLKLMGNSGGFERAMNSPYRAFYYAVPKGRKEHIIKMGINFIDKNLAK
ncbi:hypothetical protein GF337_08395 [candidate division KSB1 bacterium]|nr:hypothetical protein [candidate division KSB1 bacterium]